MPTNTNDSHMKFLKIYYTFSHFPLPKVSDSMNFNLNNVKAFSFAKLYESFRHGMTI